jgi:hypothetical protein
MGLGERYIMKEEDMIDVELDDETVKMLDLLKGKDESYSDVLERILIEYAKTLEEEE